MTADRAGARRAAAQLLTATLAVALACVVTWIVAYSLVAGWIGLGLITLSLPVGPVLAIAATHRLFPPLEGPRILPVVLGTWTGAVLALTAYVFAASQERPWDKLGPRAALVPGAFVSAIIGASLPRHEGRAM